MSERVTWPQLTRLRDHDVLSVRETAGPPDRLQLSLAAGSRVSWWKALKLVDRATGRLIREVETRDSDRGPKVLAPITRAEASGAKLVLAKAKMFGVHTDMYEIYELTDRLGRSIDLVWERDAPDNIWGVIGSFVSDVADGAGRAIATVVRTVVTVVEWTVGLVADALAWVVNLLLMLPVLGAVRMLLTAIAFVVMTIVGQWSRPSSRCSG